jgi:hypothetical protein
MSGRKNQFAFSVVDLEVAIRVVFHGILRLKTLIVAVKGCK